MMDMQNVPLMFHFHRSKVKQVQMVAIDGPHRQSFNQSTVRRRVSFNWSEKRFQDMILPHIWTISSTIKVHPKFNNKDKTNSSSLGLQFYKFRTWLLRDYQALSHKKTTSIVNLYRFHPPTHSPSIILRDIEPIFYKFNRQINPYVKTHIQSIHSHKQMNQN